MARAGLDISIVSSPIDALHRGQFRTVKSNEQFALTASSYMYMKAQILSRLTFCSQNTAFWPIQHFIPIGISSLL